MKILSHSKLFHKILVLCIDIYVFTLIYTYCCMYLSFSKAMYQILCTYFTFKKEPCGSFLKNYFIFSFIKIHAILSVSYFSTLILGPFGNFFSNQGNVELIHIHSSSITKNININAFTIILTTSFSI